MDFADKIWVEKYTPKSVDDLCLPEHCSENDEVNELEEKIFLADKRIISQIISAPSKLQHMLFFSEMTGTGKTSTFKMIANLIKTRYKYINASLCDDEKTIKNEIISFSNYNTFKNNNVPKLIILDEIDGANAIAFQDPLRSTINSIAGTSRVGMTCNYIDKVIPALQSRCIKVDFNHSNLKYLNEIKSKMVNRLENICKLENVEYDLEFIKTLVESNYPDFRTALDNAQMISNLCGKLTTNPSGSSKFTYEEVITALEKGDYANARAAHLKLQLNSNIYLVLLRYFEKLSIHPLKKLEIVTIIGNANNFHNECVSKEVNIAYMFAEICKVILEK